MRCTDDEPRGGTAARPPHDDAGPTLKAPVVFDAARRAAVRVRWLLLALVLGGCQREAITTQAAKTAELYRFFMWCAGFVFAIVMGLIIWEVLRYRRRGRELPKQTHGSTPLEITWTVLPLVLVIVLFVYTFVVQNDITQNPTPGVSVNVLGFQWGWRFQYLANPNNPTGGVSATVLGTAEHQPTMYLPVGEKVRFTLNSADVIHDFYVPEFLYKMDVIPGRTNVFTVTLTRTGTFTARCATFCGAQHANMGFFVKVVTPGDYQRWLLTQTPSSTVAGTTGLPSTS
jgi:cytochrome c oxidase subunit II